MFFDVFNQNVCTFLLSEEENKIKKEEKITFHDWAYKFEGVFRKDFCSVIFEDDDDDVKKTTPSALWQVYRLAVRGG